MSLVLAACLVYFSISFSCVASVRVCSTFPDYDWIFSRSCYDDPVANQNITEIIQGWGFTAEEHYITTEDGYKILLERSYAKITQRNPIIIVHGIGMSANGFVDRGNVSLAYLLGKLGYDVWLLSYRGTWYSKGHVSLSPRDRKYWSFSLNELGIYDIRSTVKHVNKKTNKRAIYIGYSMGSTGFYIYSTTFPDETQSYIKGMIGLAPVINYKGVKSIAAYSALPTVWPALKSVIYSLWNGEILPGYSVFLRPLTKFSLGMYLIQSGANLVFGDDYALMDPLRYPQFATHLLDTAGVEVYTHYVQIFQNGRFQNYDHGRAENMEIYGQPYPPAYNLSKVPVPVALFVGKNDWLATRMNAEQLYSELRTSSRCGYHLIEHPKWNHIDFLVAKDIEWYLYRHVFDKIRQMGSEKCQA